MKNLKIQNVLSLMIAVFVAFGILAVGTANVDAASGKNKAYISGRAGDNKIYVGDTGSAGVYNTKTGKSLSITSLKVGNKSTIKPKKYSYRDAKGKKIVWYELKGKKVGKTKVTIKYKVNGKTKTVKKTVKVIAYPNPIESIKVNDKTVKLTGEARFMFDQKWKKNKAKIEITPSEGWKIVEVYGSCWNQKSTKSTKIKGIKKAVKKGTDFTLAKNRSSAYVDIVLEKDGKTFYYSVDFWK